MLCVQNLIMIGDQQANRFACIAFEILQNHKWTFVDLAIVLCSCLLYSVLQYFFLNQPYTSVLTSTCYVLRPQAHVGP